MINKIIFFIFFINFIILTKFLIEKILIYNNKII